jgi:hypothetical protein
MAARRHRRVVVAGAVGVAAGLAVLGAGCSSGGNALAIDTSSIRPQVADQLAEVGLTLQSIDCPTSAQPAVDAPITCTASLADGGKVGMTVGLEEAGGHQRLTWKLGPDLISTDALLADLTTFARTAVSDDLSVTCPKVVVLAGGNGALTCQVSDPKGQQGKLLVPLRGGRPVASRDQWSIDQS